MPRYKFHIAYKGTNYSGWQRQPNAHTVQAEIESKLATIFQNETPIIGCGRTDTGVHASSYYFHTDIEDAVDFDMKHRMNRMLPNDIVVREVAESNNEFHARFDATARTYDYFITRNMSPFHTDIRTHLPSFAKLNIDTLREVAGLILDYDEFFPFCKSRHDSETMKCEMMKSQWNIEADQFIYTIQANRFLRGMVRLIVGISIRAALGEVAVSEIKQALDSQTRLEKSWSAPAQGLFLSEIIY